MKPLMAKSKAPGKDFELVRAGTHPAVCTAIIDQGLQPNERFGPSRKVYFRFEVGDQQVKWTKDGQEHEGPAIVGRTLTLSTSEKSHLRPMIEAWISRRLTKTEEDFGFDLSQLLGRPCLIQVIHGEKGDRKFANIGGVMQLPGGMPAPKPAGATLYYNTDDPDPKVFDQLPSWLQEKIDNRLQEQDLKLDDAEVLAAMHEDDKVPF